MWVDGKAECTVTATCRMSVWYGTDREKESSIPHENDTWVLAYWSGSMYDTGEVMCKADGMLGVR